MFTLKQQLTINMDNLKDFKPNKGKRWVQRHGNFEFMEIDDRIDFLYLSYFVAIHKCNQNKHYILQPFMYTL
jgi:hypothetical protein